MSKHYQHRNCQPGTGLSLTTAKTLLHSNTLRSLVSSDVRVKSIFSRHPYTL